MKIIVFLAAACIVIAPLICPGETPPDVVKIGVVLSMTGDQAKLGEIKRNSFLLAVDEMNRIQRAKGLPPLALIMEDDNGQPDLARLAAEKLISDDAVIVLTGASRSETGWEIARTAQEKKVPFLVTSGAADEITEQGWEYVFRIGPPFSRYFEPLMSFLNDVAQPQTVAIIYENTLFGRRAALRMAQAFEENGGRVLESEMFEIGRVDFTPFLRRVKKGNPDVVFMCATDFEGAVMMRTAQEMNIVPKMFVGAAQEFTVTQFMVAAGGASEYVFCIDLWNPRLPDTDARKYFDDYVMRFLSSPNYHGAQAYSCIEVIANALHRAQPLTRDGVRRALAETDLKTAFGHVRFVSDGNKTQQNKVRTFLGQWQGGVLEPVWPKEFASSQYVYPFPPWKGRP
jgi:branched-chain amino acid transport system substrate-binding protein